MQRNWDLVRALLFSCSDERVPASAMPVLHAASEADVAFHRRIMVEGGLLEFSSNHVSLSIGWNGHELIDASRDEQIWLESRRHLQDRGFWPCGMAILLATLHAKAAGRLAETVESVWSPHESN